MPNWCENRLHIEGAEADILNLLEAIHQDNLLNYMRPQPEQPDGECGDSVLPAWYTWRVNNWGTKWDVAAEVVGQSPTHLLICFESAWGPPIEAIQHWHSQDAVNRSYNIRYIEWGMAFCGEEDSDGTSIRANIPRTLEDAKQLIPEELDNEFGISEVIAQWED